MYGTNISKSKTYGSNSLTTLSSRVRPRRKRKDDLLLQLFASEQLHAGRILGEESLESLDRSRRSEKLAEERCSKCFGIPGRDGSGCDSCAGSRRLRLGECVDGDGHETSDEELSDGNHDY